MTEHMKSLSQSLCLTCGLCCDGTLFTFVQLTLEDDITPLEAVGINVQLTLEDDIPPLEAVDINTVSDSNNVSGSAPNIFKQPCAAHKNCTCIVYANRPQRCRTYKCELLKRFEREDIFHDAALEIINKTVSLKNEVKAAVLAASTDMQPAEEITLLMQRWLGDPSVAATNQSYAHVFLKFMILQMRLDRFFRKTPIVQTVARRTSEGASPSKSSNLPSS